MRKARRKQIDQSVFELLSDLSLSTLGLFLIIFVIYAIIFRTQGVKSVRIAQKNTSLANQVDVLKVENFSIRREKQRLEDKKNVLSEANQELRDEKSVLSEANQELRDEKSVLSETNQELRDEKSVLSEANQELRDEKSVLSEANQELRDEKKLLSEANQELRDEKKLLSEANQELKDRVRSLGDQVNKLQAQMERNKYTGYYVGNNTIPFGCSSLYQTRINVKESVYYFQDVNLLIYTQTHKELGTISFEYFGNMDENVFTGTPKTYSRGENILSCNPSTGISLRFYDDYVYFGGNKLYRRN
ncbi:MAG: hypothetical protein AAGG51_26370 [Cyanobacteria bacterium P01_G01_bin.54]